jgi:hypothetical protein
MHSYTKYESLEIKSTGLQHVEQLNLYASGFKWLQCSFAYDIPFAGDLNFSTRFSINVNITRTKQDQVVVQTAFFGSKTDISARVQESCNNF